MSDFLGYHGRTVVVTGCASGVGSEVAMVLKDAGARVIGMDRVEPSVAVDRFVQIDLSDSASIDGAAAKVESLDCLFNVAGISSGAGDPTKVVAVNFLGPRMLTEALLPKMADGGAVVGVASISALRFQDNLEVTRELVDTPDFVSGVEWCASHADMLVSGSYRVAKEAVVQYTMLQAIRHAGRNIRFNCTGPGAIDTPFLKDTVAKLGTAAIDKIPKPLGRLSQPREQANVLVFLNSRAASYVTAQLLWVDGGFEGGAKIGAVQSDR